MIKKLSLLLLICILSALNINAEIYEGSCGENVSFSLNLETGVLNITGTGDMTDYYITSNIPWYSQMSKIKSVEIAEGVTRIGERTFLNCTSLTNVSMPNSLTSIGYCAFAGCSALNSVIIPNNVTSIGKGGFQNCSGLVSLSIGNSVTAIGSLAFQNCPLLKEVIIPNSVKSIGNNTFEGCIGLTSIDIPNGVIYIGYAAFQNCSGITSINIPNSVYYIGDCAFDGTAWNENLPEGLIYVGKVFYKYKGVMPENTSVTITEGTIGIAGSAFEGCSGLISVTIPNTIKSIAYYAFRGCSNLAEVYCKAEKNPTTGGDMLNGVPLSNATLYVPEVSLEKYQSTEPWSGFGTIKTIEEVEKIVSGSCGENVNYSLNLETGVLSITGTGAMTDYSYTGGAPWYAQRENIKSVEIADGVTTIGERTFRNCSAITSISISNSVTSIKSYAFSSCSSLTSVIIPIGVTSIGLGAFDSKLSSIVVAEGNAKFDSRDNCNAVIETATNTLIKICKNTVIPNSVTSIGSYAFYRCLDLSSITIPNSVTSLEDYAFYDCPGLTSVDMLSNIESIGTGAFRSTTWYDNHPDGMIYVGKVFYKYKGTMPENTSISIDEGILGIAGSAFDGCTGLTSINIPNSVKSIGNNAFSNCSSLTSVISEIEEPFAFGSNAFGNISSSCALTVPYGTRDAYIAAGWTTDVFKGGIVEIISGSCGENVNYSLNLKTGALSITGTGAMTSTPWNSYKDYIKNVIISDGVTSICDYAFYYCSGLTSVTIGNNVESIGNDAFHECSALTSIEIPNSVTSIGERAFRHCFGLTSVEIPNSVTSMGGGVFESCTNLASVTIGNNVTSIGKVAFNNCRELTSITIPNSVTLIGEMAFSSSKVTSVNISDLTSWCNISFGEKVFSSEFVLSLNGSPLQEQIIIPDGITRIRSYSFQKVKDAYSFVIPSTLQTIENNAFNPDYITEVIINTDNIVSLASASVFSDKTAIYVKDDLVSDYRGADQWSEIKNQIFVQGCRQLTVELEAAPNSPALLTALTAWEQTNSEYKIARLADLKIKGTLNGWDILMIRNKMPNLHRLDLGEASILDNDGGMEYYTGYHTIAGTISPYTFYELDNLTSVVLPNNITSIDYRAFASSGLQSISLPSTVKEIKSNAFSSCLALNTVELNKGLETIGSDAFSNCSALSTIELNKGLETIGYEAFRNCNSLRKLVLPSTLKKIENGAFGGCNNLTDIEFAEGLEEIGSSAFSGCSKLNNLHLPTSLTKIGGSAFNKCSGLSEVHVPSMITEIGDYAFKGCGLKSVYAYTVVPVQINQNTFDYDGVNLYAPANSFYAYYLNTQWSQFLDVKEFDALYTNWYMPKNTDLEINTDKPITSEDEEKAADGEMEAGSGMIITGDGEQEVNELVMESEEGEGYPTLIENDNLTVEKLTFKINVRPGRWYFFSFPFNVNMSDIKHEGKWVWRYYDSETRAAQGVGGWKNTVGDVLKANQGYIFQCNKAGILEISVAKPVFGSSEEKDIALEYLEAKKPQDASWNFVGNPNLSYYSLDDMAEKFDAPITVWNDEQQTYTAVIPGDDDYNFHPFEAYFVQTPENVDKMTFENENRATYLQSEKKKSSNQARSATRSGQSVNEKRMLVNLTVSDGQTIDKTRVIFNDDNKMTYETGRDANKFMSMVNVPQIYTIDAQDVKYSINARPNENRQVRIGYVASSDGNYTIAAERMDCRMALKDNVTGTVHQLDEKPYSFYSEAGTFESRFTLISSADITSINTNGLEGIQGLDITAMDGGISVAGANEGDLNVYNANGIKAGSLQGSGTIMLANGTYIITYAGKSTKIVIK